MMSSCSSGGSRTYGFNLEIVNSPPTSTLASPASSSPTSTVSDSSNSPLSISTRKARTRRKRPNQTYNEAAALLSTAYPNIFSSTRLTNPLKSHRPHLTYSPDESTELLLPFRLIDDESVSLIQQSREEQKPPFFLGESRPSPSCERSCQTPDENEIQSKAAAPLYDEEEDFDAESMLNEDIEEGIIDSIMGERKGSLGGEKPDGVSKVAELVPPWSGTPMALLGLGGRLDIRYGIRKAGVRAWKDAGEVNWWNLMTVDVNEFSPKLNNPNPIRAFSNNQAAALKKKKKKKKVVEAEAEKPQTSSNAETTSGEKEENSPETMMGLGGKKCGLMLRLDYNNVLEGWTSRGSPFPDDSPASRGNDVAVSESPLLFIVFTTCKNMLKSSSFNK